MVVKKKLREPRNYKHGMKGTRLYNVWINMRQRCYNKNMPSYKNYGERGIVVCEEWHDFAEFYKWAMENGYKNDLTIERINVNGNYEPNNCKWATREEQAYNKRNNRYITYNGKTQTMKEWSVETGINYFKIRDRLRRGWSVERTLNTK